MHIASLTHAHLIAYTLLSLLLLLFVCIASHGTHAGMLEHTSHMPMEEIQMETYGHEGLEAQEGELLHAECCSCTQ